MDRKAQASLKKALAWIKRGKINKARPLLAGLLRGDPQNAQAWFLLSYTLDEPQRQQYALMQALGADPEFSRARQRLEKLRAGGIGEFPVEGKENLGQKLLSDTQPLEPSVIAEPELLRDTEVPAADEEPAERERPNLRRPLATLLLVVAIGLLGFLAIQFFTPAASSPQASATPTASATSTFTPTVAATATSTSTATATVQAPLVDALTLAQMQAIQQQVSDLRGLRVSQEVENFIVSERSAELILADAFFDSSKAQQLEGQEVILRALGLLAASDQLGAYELNRRVDPQGGFYLPNQNGIFLVGESFTGRLPYAYSRLYAQALISQNHPAVDALIDACSVLSDSCRAVRALTGGEAAWLGSQWLEAHGSEELALELEDNPTGTLLFQAQGSTQFALGDLAFPFEQGQDFVKSIFDLGGWERVNSLYANPPLSSEQILHAEKYLAGEAPLVVSDPAFGPVLGSAWTSLGSGTLGEWLTYLILTGAAQPAAALPEDVEAGAAAGWGGDLFQVYERASDGAVALAAHWVMDSEGDATQLSAALAENLALRFADAASSVGSGACWVGEGRRACLYVDGAEVLWLLGPDEIVVIQVMLSHYPQLQ